MCSSVWSHIFSFHLYSHFFNCKSVILFPMSFHLNESLPFLFPICFTFNNPITKEYIICYLSLYMYLLFWQVACALLMAGENLDNHVDVKNILVEMGTYFQVQDDYLDCFGDPQTIGKVSILWIMHGYLKTSFSFLISFVLSMEPDRHRYWRL